MLLLVNKVYFSPLKNKTKRHERYSGCTWAKAFLMYSLGYWKALPTLLGGACELEARGAEPSLTFHDLTFRSNTGDLIDVLGVSGGT